MLNLNLNECKSVENLTKKHEKEWLKEYMQFLEDHTMWDTSFIDFLHYKIFLMDFKLDIQLYINEYKNETGGDIPFEEAGWAMYLIMTGQEHKILNQHGEA